MGLGKFGDNEMGMVPASGGGTSNFMRADGTWAAPPAGGTPPTGTGFRHITAGAEDAAAKLVDTADINADQVTFAKMVNLSGSTTFVGRFSTGAGDPEELSGASATQMLSLYTSTIRGAVPPVVSGTTQFLRADATWQQPPGSGGPTYTYKGNTQSSTGLSLADITGLTFAVTSGQTYHFEFYIVYASSATTTGLKLGMTFPTAWVWGCYVNIPTAVQGTTMWEGQITATGGSVTSTSTALNNTDHMAQINGLIGVSVTGTLSAQFASEISGSTITIKKGSFGKLFTIA